MRRLFIILAVSVLSAAALQSPPDFELRYFAVQGHRHHTVTFDFNGDGRIDLLNVTIDMDVDPPERWFILHLQQEGGIFREKPDRVWPVSDRAITLLFGDYLPEGGVEIAWMARDGIHVHPSGPDGPDPRAIKLLHLRTFPSRPSLRAIPVCGYPTDLDSDGRHDLLVPVPDGYRAYFQTEPGVFGASCRIETDPAAPVGPTDRALKVERHADAREFVASLFDSVRSIPRLEVRDINGDGKADLVTIDGDLLTVFFQTNERTFPAQRPHRIRLPVPVLRPRQEKDHVGVMLVHLPDYNGDGLTDLAVTRVEGQLGFLESIRTGITLLRGTGRGNFVPEAVIRVDGISIDPVFMDMNGDGALDCMVSRLRTDILAQAFQAAVLGDIQVTYEVFQYDPAESGFRETPSYTKHVFVPTGDVSKMGAASVPMIYVQGDHSGDGRPDMVFIDPKEETIFLHEGGERELLGETRINFVTLPFWKRKLQRHPDWVATGDLNGDGLRDIFLMHRGTLGIIFSRKKP